MKTFPIAIASAVIGLSLVAGGFHSATAEQSGAGPEDFCYYSISPIDGKASCTVDTGFAYTNCPVYETVPPDNKLFVVWAKGACLGNGSGNGSGTP